MVIFLFVTVCVRWCVCVFVDEMNVVQCAQTVFIWKRNGNLSLQIECTELYDICMCVKRRIEMRDTHTHTLTHKLSRTKPTKKKQTQINKIANNRVKTEIASV